MGYDIGNVIGNLFFAWARIQFIEPRHTEFITWCSHTVADTIDLTMEKLSKVYEQCVECPLYRTKEFKQHYLRDVMSDSLGYAGTEIMPALYIADGHHRSAAAALVGAEKAQQNANHQGNEEYNYFMAVCFPANQLTIIDYNRVVKDLNGLSPEQFLTAVSKNFVVEEKGTEVYRPQALHNFSLYLDGKWYSLTAKPGTYDDNDPIGVLDVTISSNLILDEILGIKDLRSDKRIDFVGGIRGLEELKKRVDSGEMKVALALYPVSMKQLMDIADTGNIMPPKTTWFEPKLRSGLVIHKLS